MNSDATPGRYAPELPLPPYAYLPGRDPHPTQDPEGHSFARGHEETPAYIEAARWRENPDYLFGVDLYNRGFLWEAHEAWEGIWHAARHDARQAGFLQGLIQCAAAALKLSMDQPRGLARLAEMGTAKLDEAAPRPDSRYMGLAVDRFVAGFRGFAERARESEAAEADDRPKIVLAD
ncbi:MAG: DUF309 domain-containing protein [Planctomycetota bacterium]|nr:DUF309 domain-containing protein [Planctomycetota bacterium]MDP6761834.1 DUF309 domain-containing protein [Planctomycetota bacterium]MDP6988880.1 DUF309 domain-containing protein [Planctomycetota bacterium]